MNQTNIEQARFNMIEQQIRPWDVLDQRVLEVLTDTPRENFVPEKYRALAFTDTHIPLGNDQVMMDPKLEGRLLQALSIQPEDRVLEIGTGSAYLTACLAKLASHVTSIEINPAFFASATEKLAAAGCRNVDLHEVDAMSSDPLPGRPYNAIAVTGSLPLDASKFYQYLAMGGRLFVITGTPPIMEAQLITRIETDNFACESLFETSIPPLVNATQPSEFTL